MSDEKIDPTAFGRSTNYAIPGVKDQSFTVVGFHDGSRMIDGPIYTDRSEPFELKTLRPAHLRRSPAWWLTGWWPLPWRTKLCDRFGHPESCVGSEVRTTVRTTSSHDAGEEWTLDFQAVSPSVARRWCERCGRDV